MADQPEDVIMKTKTRARRENQTPAPGVEVGRGGTPSPIGTASPSAIDELCVNTIRTLSIDAVQQAKSGHPGTPMALAPVMFTLWQRFLRFDPNDPIWPNRDRFVLSNGHASMLLYSMLHLAGVKAVDKNNDVLGSPAVGLEDIKRFRQLDG